MRKLTVIVMLAALAVAAAAPRAATAETTAADRPVLLADSQAFESAEVAEIGRAEIAEARRKLAAAVSSEKFMEGFAAAFAAGVFICLTF